MNDTVSLLARLLSGLNQSPEQGYQQAANSDSLWFPPGEMDYATLLGQRLRPGVSSADPNMVVPPVYDPGSVTPNVEKRFVNQSSWRDKSGIVGL
jgi:hypothetical protein